MNPIVGTFLKAQLLLVSTLELTLRLGRVVIVRFVQSLGALGAGASEASDLATAASAVSVLSGAVLESRAIVQNDWLDLMRFQCYGIFNVTGKPSKMCSLSIDFLKTHRSVTNDRPIRCFRSQGVPKAFSRQTDA